MAPELIRKTRPVQKDCYACMEYNYDWFCNDIEEPYTTYPNMPFSWQGRLRITGGRTHVWGRQSYRLSGLDFKAASHDGYGVDWPISYKDLAPYYDIVEEYVGITGIPEGVYELPDGKFQPPMGLTCAETLFRNRIKEKFGRTVTLGRSANLTRPINGRAPCHYCGPCERGCITHSYFNSYFTTVADALKSGNCTLIPNAMVYKVLMDHITGAGAYGELEDLGGKPNMNGPNRPDGIYVIRFRNTHNGPRSKNFLRGYGYQGGGAARFNWGAPGFGEAYKRAIKNPVTGIGLGGFGECLARWDNYVEIDPNVVDTFGIPVLRFHMTYGENEFAMLKDMADSAAEMLEAAGAKNVSAHAHANAPGWAIHEVGIARMGDDPKASVLNQFEQSHDIKNLFVMDGSAFPSTACQNPTLTIMALAVRSCDYLMQEMKKGNI